MPESGVSVRLKSRVSVRRALCVGLATLLAACASDTKTPAVRQASGDAPVVHPSWTRTAAIYEVNVRQFTPEGTLDAVVPHLTRLKDLGVDILWLMPVQPIGRKNRKGSLGSYYSIADYTEVNPEFGTRADFRALVDTAHALGFKVILDWVPNHTAFDHVWTRDHKDYYTLRPDGSISVARDNEGKETDWTDVADLNYDNREMRRAMIGAMKWWLDSMNIDGFRVDVAWGVPADFWSELRPALVSSRPDLFLLAEAEDPKLHQWFDMTYGWEFHHTLNDIAKGKKGFGALDDYFEAQKSAYPSDAMRMYFTSNHDENSWQGTEFERMGANHQAAFVLAATVQNGMPLIYTGQEASLNKRLRFFEKDTVSWQGPSLTPFYRRMLALKDSSRALANGALGGTQSRIDVKLWDAANRTTDAGKVYALGRVRDADTVVVLVNFAARPASVYVDDPKWHGRYRDWFDAKQGAFFGMKGAYLALPAHGFRVLVR
jgi:alpha-amylase